MNNSQRRPGFIQFLNNFLFGEQHLLLLTVTVNYQGSTSGFHTRSNITYMSDCYITQSIYLKGIHFQYNGMFLGSSDNNSGEMLGKGQSITFILLCLLRPSHQRHNYVQCMIAKI